MKTFPEIKAEFDANREAYRKGKGTLFNPQLRGLLLGEIQRACGAIRSRHDVQKALFHKESSKNVTEDVWYALGKFVFGDARPTWNDGAWNVRGGLTEDCLVILDHVEARRKYEQDLLREIGYDDV